MNLDDTAIKFSQVEVIIPIENMPTFCDNNCKDDVRNKFWDWIDDWNSKQGVETQIGILSSPNIMWVDSSKAFLQGAITGTMFAVAVAFLVVLMFTRNWIMSLLVLLVIVGILSTTVLLFRIAGFELGTIESIAVVIVIGFSVDYTVHFAHAFLECKSVIFRRERTVYSFLIMGVSVLFGFLTTLVSALPLSIAQSMFYSKFGIIIIMCICSAYTWATIFFPALLLLVGPRKGAGDFCQCMKSKSDEAATEMATNDKGLGV